MRLAPPDQRGVSLIEALVALAVMAFGMLGIVGVQSTLRLNSDVAKQRSEAVRLGQQMMEDSRAFIEVALPATGGVPNYGNVGASTQVIDPDRGYLTIAGAQLAAYGTNTSYSVTRQLITLSGDADNSPDPRMKTVQVNVQWSDRTGTAQNVILNAVISRNMPELSGSLVVASSVGTNGVPTRGPMGRNAVIPVSAVNFGSSSGYIPPGRPSGDTTAFLFNNTTGVITLCSTAVASNALLTSSAQLSCTLASAFALSGTISFATAGTAIQAMNPSGTAQSVQLGLTQTFPTSGVGAPSCYTEPVTAGIPFVRYICAVPVSASSSPASVWSGYSYVTGSAITWAAGGYSVCRYTAGPPAVSSRSDLVAPAISNVQHPRAYANASRGLAAQNLLIVPYGTGAASDCPDGSPLPSGSTTYPQPATAP
jgi:type II secretory pathway pseudopilin PulG